MVDGECGKRFRNLIRQPSGSNWSGVYMLVGSSFHLVGVWFLQKQLGRCASDVGFQVPQEGTIGPAALLFG